jgi:hypothetical protein
VQYESKKSVEVKVKVGLWNVGLHGMSAEQEVGMVKAAMILEGLGVMAVVETWRGRDEWMLKRELGEDFLKHREGGSENRSLLGGDCVWVEWNRKAFNVRGKKGDGGLGLAVSKECLGAEGVVEVQEGDSVEDLMWVRVDGRMGVWFVCVMYMRPGSRWEDSRARVWQAYVKGVSKFRGKGRIVVLTDANARIGEMQSTVGDIVFERESKDKKVERQGREFVEKSDELGMVILNGTRGSVAEYTCWHRSGVGKSMIDLVCVEVGNVDEWGSVQVGCMWQGESDHELVMVEWKGDGKIEGKRGAGERQGRKGGNGNGKSMGEKIKKMDVRRVRKNDWKKLRDRGVMMGEWVGWMRREGDEKDIQVIFQRWMDNVRRVVEGAEEEDEGVRGERGRVWGRDLEEMRKKKIKARRKWVSTQEGEGKLEAKRKWRVLVKEMKNLVRRKVVQDKLDRMRKIERMGSKNPRKMWQEWKRWGKEREEGVRGGIDMVDGEGKKVSGDQIAGKWAEVFKKVVVEMKGEYDESWKEEVKNDLSIMGEEREEEEIEEEVGKSVRYKDGRSLNVRVKFEEVEFAVENMKNGKASGVDEVILEILKYGGEEMMTSVFMLCEAVWKKETVPQEWMKGVIFPILKKGSDKDMRNYRGISLLSVVGKVFGVVLNNRVIQWAEGVLVEEQFGFRPGRGCRDPLFILREVVRNRGRKTVFAAFMDIKKAYPSVWRDGLWWKLWRMGVRGKFWRVLREWSSDRKCGVVWEKEVGEWFDMESGVAQGCPLSPVLFSLYINDIALDIREKGGGVQYGDVRVSVLMYADDMVLMADTKEGLQRSINLAYEYSKRWRFLFNVGKDKTEIVVFHGRGMEKKKREKELEGGWVLGGKIVGIVDKYVYLGVTVDCKGKFDGWRREREKKTKNAWWGAWKMGIDGQWVTVRNAVMIWKVMVQSVLDYATEVFGGFKKKWEEAEKIARRMGKAILGVRKSTTNEVVMGELGWWTMKGRRDFLRLLYWREIVAKKKGLRWEVYQECRKRVGGDEEAWCDYTRKCMRDLELDEWWESQDDMEIEADDWRSMVFEKMQNKEQEEWRVRMEGKSKLRTYRLFKQVLEREPYLEQGTASQRRVMAMMRGGSNDLRIETGRYEKLEVEKRVCIFCDTKEVEDEHHFLCKCDAWADQRSVVLQEVRDMTKEVLIDEEIMFVSGRDVRKKGVEGDWRQVVLDGVGKMEKRRKREWRSKYMGV